MGRDGLYYYASVDGGRSCVAIIAASVQPFVTSLLRNCFRFESLKYLHAHQKDCLPIRLLPLLQSVTVRHVFQELAKLVPKCIT
jgi:hypothetical protein